jgi:hypothetical protein
MSQTTRLWCADVTTFYAYQTCPDERLEGCLCLRARREDANKQMGRGASLLSR